MNVWLDHLSAVLIGAVVILIGGGVLLTRSSGAREDVQLYAGEVARDALISQIEIDFENLGAGRLAGERPVVSHDSVSVAFRSISDTLGTRALIRYDLVPVDSAAGIARHRIQRTVGGVASGGTAANIMVFNLTFRDASGAEVAASSSDIRAVDVWVQWALPFSDRSAQLRSASWGTTIHPAPLRLGN